MIPSFHWVGTSSFSQMLLKRLYSILTAISMSGLMDCAGISSGPAVFPLLRVVMTFLISAFEGLSQLMGSSVSAGGMSGGESGVGRLSSSLKCSAHRFSCSLPAKWLCDASSVLVGVWLLVTFRFQPAPLASMLLAAPQKGEQSVSLSLPVYSLSTASPMQCLLVAAGVYGCRKAQEPNCKGEISMTQR